MEGFAVFNTAVLVCWPVTSFLQNLEQRYYVFQWANVFFLEYVLEYCQTFKNLLTTLTRTPKLKISYNSLDLLTEFSGVCFNFAGPLYGTRSWNEIGYS